MKATKQTIKSQMYKPENGYNIQKIDKETYKVTLYSYSDMYQPFLSNYFHVTKPFDLVYIISSK